MAVMNGQAEAYNTLSGLMEPLIAEFDKELAWSLAEYMVLAAVTLSIGAGLRTLLIWWRGIRPDLVLLRRIITGTSPAEARASFAEHYEEVDQVLSRSGPGRTGLATAWLEFKETLVDITAARTSVTSPIKQNTIRPQVFYAGAVPAPRWLGFFSNLFVGFGLLFTFIGLIAALQSFALSMADGTIAMEAALQAFIGIAAAKFITSIAGVACSIFLRISEALCTSLLRRGTTRLCALLERGLKFAPAQSLADETLQQSREQTDLLKVMGESIAIRLGEQIGDVMQPLGETLTGIKAAVEDGAKEQAASLQQAVTTSISESTGSELKRLAEVLEQVPSVLEGLDRKLEASGEKAATQLSAAAADMKEGLAGLPALIEEATQASAGRVANTGEETRAAVAALLKMTEEAAQSREDAASAGAQRLIERMDATMSALTQRLERASELQSKHLEEAAARSSEEMASRLRGASDAIDGAAGRLQDGFAEAPARFKVAADDAATALREAASATAQDLLAAGNRLAESSSALASLNEVAARFEKASASASGELAGIVEAARENQRAAKALTELLDNRSDLAVQSLTDAAKGIDASQRAAEHSLRQAETLAASIQATQESLTTAWSEHRDRFGSVDQELGAALEKLGVHYAGFADKVSDLVGAMDAALGKNVQSLAEATDELNDNVEALTHSLEGSRMAAE